MKLEDIIQQNLVKPIDSLAGDSELCREVQTRLQVLGLLPANGVDGIYEPKQNKPLSNSNKKSKKANWIPWEHLRRNFY